VQGVVGLLPLLAEVRRAVSLPLLAACGIGDPASARAAVAAGAQAVVMGIRFPASDESDAHPRYKARLLEAEARDTVPTQLFDVGWAESPHRVLRNSTHERWEAANPPLEYSRTLGLTIARNDSEEETCRRPAALSRPAAQRSTVCWPRSRLPKPRSRNCRVR
jgi:NAD(P)H-dependent flavin oxidoreductase YrpB (nitropropane dioxygenase family)